MDLLCEDVIHRILNLLPTQDAARTSGVCKSWKSAWDSRPTVDLDLQHHFASLEQFTNFLEISLQSYLRRPEIIIEKFSLRYDVNLSNLMDRWLDLAARSTNLKHLQISIESPDHYRLPYYIAFPPTIFGSNSLTTLTLSGHNVLSSIFFPNNTVYFPTLKNLNLVQTFFTATTLRILLSSSPLLENFCLRESDGALPEVLSHVRLQSLSFYRCSFITMQVVIQVPSLQHFSCSCASGSPQECQIMLAACEQRLKQLRLHTMRLSADHWWLKTQVLRLVALEVLDLYDIYSTKDIRISSQSLKELVIRDCQNLHIEIVIDAPNVRSVKFINNKSPFYSLPASNNLSKVEFNFCLNRDHSIIWLHKVEELFARTNHIKGLRVAIQGLHDETMILHKQLKASLFRKIYNLKDSKNLEINIKSSVSSEDWMRYWKSSTNLDCVYLASPSYSNIFIKVKCAKLFNYCKEATRCSSRKIFKLTTKKRTRKTSVKLHP